MASSCLAAMHPVCDSTSAPSSCSAMWMPFGSWIDPLAPFAMVGWASCTHMCVCVCGCTALTQPVRVCVCVCAGVLVLARTRNSETNKSVLDGCNATCLPKYMENSAYALTCCCRGRYYRTYPATVQSEVVAALGPRGRFYRGPVTFDR